MLNKLRMLQALVMMMMIVRSKKNSIRCAECIFSQYIPTGKNDPEIVFCSVYEKRYVANSLRKCISFKRE